MLSQLRAVAFTLLLTPSRTPLIIIFCNSDLHYELHPIKLILIYFFKKKYEEPKTKYNFSYNTKKTNIEYIDQPYAPAEAASQQTQ